MPFEFNFSHQLNLRPYSDKENMVELVNSIKPYQMLILKK